MKKKSIVIQKKGISFMIMGLIVFEPPFFGEYPLINSIWTAFQIILGIYFTIYCFVRKRPKGEKGNSEAGIDMVILILLFNISLLISTVINHGQIEYMVRKAILYYIYTIFVVYGIRKNTKCFITGIVYILTLYVFVNFLTTLFFYEGISWSYINGIKYQSHWFLGAKNNMILFLVPSLIIARIYSEWNNNKWLFWILYILCLPQVLWNSTTSTIAMIYIFVIELIVKKWNPKYLGKLLNMRTGIIASYVISVLMILTNELLGIMLFINRVFSKRQFMSGRNYIWRKALISISNNIYMGVGFEEDAVTASKLGGPSASHCHNYYLDVMYRGGIVASLILIIIFIVLSNKTRECENLVIGMEVVALFLVYTLVMFQVEAYFDFGMTFFMIMIVSNLRNICNENYKIGQ